MIPYEKGIDKMSNTDKKGCLVLLVLFSFVFFIGYMIYDDVTSRRESLERTFRLHLEDKGYGKLSNGNILINADNAWNGVIHITGKVDGIRKTVGSVYQIKSDYIIYKQTGYRKIHTYSREPVALEEEGTWMGGEVEGN